MSARQLARMLACKVALATCVQTAPSNAELGPEISLLMSSEPHSGTSWLENIVIETMQAHCDDRTACQMSVKPKVDEFANNYTVAVSAWPGSRRILSTALKHIVPNIGHKNMEDFSSVPAITPMDLASRVDKTLLEMPAAGKYLVLFRDPRDVVMSACHAQEDGCDDPDAYARKNIKALVGWTNIRYHLFDSLRAQTEAEDRVHLFFYEDMLTDPVGVADEVSQFFGLPLRPGLSKQVVAAAERVTNATVMRQVPHLCGFTQELKPESLRVMSDAMLETLPKKLAAKWACGH